MGFVDDMVYLLSLMPEKRQVLLFSATMSKEIQNIVHKFQKNPIQISVRTGDTSQNVDQDVIRVSSKEHKMDMLHDLLVQPDFQKVIIFGKTKHGVERIEDDLRARGFTVASIHGDKTQMARQRSLRMFKEHKIQALIATDVAARGLDIPNVSHVINFDIPATYEDYTHRIGRTGRAGKTGIALTFVGA
jgi:superfamily II DNA/RNA helicase